MRSTLATRAATLLCPLLLPLRPCLSQKLRPVTVRLVTARLILRGFEPCDVAPSAAMMADRCYVPFTLAHVSRSVTVRLNTGRTSLHSATSLTK